MGRDAGTEGRQAIPENAGNSDKRLYLREKRLLHLVTLYYRQLQRFVLQWFMLVGNHIRNLPGSGATREKLTEIKTKYFGQQYAHPVNLM
jgi:hypothetical protein